MRRRSIHSAASWISQRPMNEAMNRKKTSSGIVFSVFAEKKSNTSAALRRGIRTSHVGADFLKSPQCGQVLGRRSPERDIGNGRFSPLVKVIVCRGLI